MTDEATTAPAADAAGKPRNSVFMLMTQAPANRRPAVDVETFKGLHSLEDVKAWMDALYQFDKPIAGLGDLPGIRSVTLCGSGRFRRHFVEWNAQLTRAGFLVYTLGNQAAGNPLTAPSPLEKATMDAVYFAKIRASDAIVVIDAKVDGKPYIGESTAREIEWAELLGKPVFYTGDFTGQDATKPEPGLWAAYNDEHMAEKARWLQGVMNGLYKRCPAAALAHSDSVYVVDVHDEYGWGEGIDENAIAEEPESFPEGSRHVVHFYGTVSEAVLVIDRNGFDDGLQRTAVRWHLEVLTDDVAAQIDAERKARHEAEMAAIQAQRAERPESVAPPAVEKEGA